MIRRTAFKYSESSYAHWLPLMLADRIGVIEGILADLSHGYIPNIFVELGGKAEWKYNRKTLLTRGFLAGVLVLAAVAYLRGERRGSVNN